MSFVNKEYEKLVVQLDKYCNENNIPYVFISSDVEKGKEFNTQMGLCSNLRDGEEIIKMLQETANILENKEYHYMKVNGELEIDMDQLMN